MKTQILFTFILFQTQFCFSQKNRIEFDNEIGFEYEFGDQLKNSILKPVNFDSIEFETRIWYLNSLSSIEVVVLKMNKDEAWSINRYEMLRSSKMDTILFFNRDVNLEIDLSQLWNKLVENQILMLKDYRDLEFDYVRNGHKLKYDSDRFDNMVSDGTLFKIELLTRTNKRKYAYKNPASFDFAFNREITEITHMLNIIDLLQQVKK